MLNNQVKPGLKIITNDKLGPTKGFMVHLDHIANRKENTKGTIEHFVPGHGRDVWFVKHDDGSIAAYCFDEFKLVK